MKSFTYTISVLLLSCLLPSRLWACQTFDDFHFTSSSSCSVSFSWTFSLCTTGDFFVEYGTDGSTYVAIASVHEATNTGTDVTRTYTDNFTCPGPGLTASYYRITFVSDAGSIYHSTVLVAHFTNGCTCTQNNTNRCASLSSLSISGADAICNSSSQTYSLSNGTAANWSITSGSSYVSMTGGTPYSTSVSLNNSSTDGQLATLQASVWGCKTVTKTIMVGVPANVDFTLYVPNQFCTNSFGNWAYTDPNTFSLPISFEWGEVDELGSTGAVVVNPFGSVQQDFTFDHASMYQITARMRNSCGYFLGNIATINEYAYDNCDGGGFSAKKQNKTGTMNVTAETEAALKPGIYPNPASNVLRVILPASSNPGKTIVKITDLLGREKS
jgi:hypothetical protein